MHLGRASGKPQRRGGHQQARKAPGGTDNMTWRVVCGNLAADSRRDSTSSWEGLALCVNLGTRQDPSPGWEHRKGPSVPRTREPQRKVPRGEMGYAELQAARPEGTAGMSP